MWVRYLSSSLTTRLRILAVFTTSNSLPSTCTGLTYRGCFGKLIRSSLDLVWCSFKRFRSDRSIISSSEGWISLGDISGTTTCVRLHIVRQRSIVQTAFKFNLVNFIEGHKFISFYCHVSPSLNKVDYYYYYYYYYYLRYPRIISEFPKKTKVGFVLKLLIINNNNHGPNSVAYSVPQRTMPWI